jgi:hypothetical protein
MTDIATDHPLMAVVAQRDSQIADLKDRLSAISANRDSVVSKRHSDIAKVKDVIKSSLTDDGLDRDEVIEIATILGITLTRTMKITGTFEATVEVPIDYNSDPYYAFDFTMEAHENDVDVDESDFVIDHVEEV